VRQAKHDDAYATMLSAREEQVGRERIDVTVRDDHEQRQVTSQCVLWTLRGVGEYRFELRKLDQHTQQSAGHRLWRQDQHFAPVRA
jgi:hypothetical protein